MKYLLPAMRVIILALSGPAPPVLQVEDATELSACEVPDAARDDAVIVEANQAVSLTIPIEAATHAAEIAARAAGDEPVAVEVLVEGETAALILEPAGEDYAQVARDFAESFQQQTGVALATMPEAAGLSA